MARRCLGASAIVGLFALAAPVGASAADAPLAPETAVPGSIGVRLVPPAIAADDPRAQLYIVDHVAPGTVINRQIEISNTTTSDTHIVLYPAAATIVDGSFTAADARTANDLSSWTSVRPLASDVPAGGTATAVVTLAVPSDAAPGEQYGVVWAETRSAPRAAGGITTVNRVGIRLYVSVGPGGAPAADFTIDAPTAKRSADGRPMVVATVHNTGGRALDLSGTLQLSGGPGGLSAGPVPADGSVTLGVGDSGPVTVTLDEQLPVGPWDARVALRSGLLERDVRATISFPEGAAPPEASASSTAPGWRYPAVAGVVVLIVVVLVGGAALVRSRRRKPAAAPAI